MKNLVLDSQALSTVARAAKDDRRARPVLAALQAALEMGNDVVVPAAVLAELYRGAGHDHLVDACLSRYPAIEVVDTTRSLAKNVGNILARAGLGSAHHVDATVVAVAVREGGGLIMTSDPQDIETLAAGLVGVDIHGL